MSLDFSKQLNPSQLEAVQSLNGPVLVIAGAGSGKTRTIVYRLAYLAQQGIAPNSMLLLTFTRKAANEMLNRASRLLGQEMQGVAGGTFHAFAYGILRRYAPLLGFDNGFSVMDRGDAEDVLKQVKDREGIGKGDKSFPKKGTILAFFSKSRNKELDLQEVLRREAFHLLPHVDSLQLLFDKYQGFKQKHGLMDYDDLLFELERLLLNQSEIKEFLRQRYTHLMVDEYQDTNLVQGRLVSLLAGSQGNVMAVGDDAQSIYAFRGATISNILQFSRTYPQAKIIKLEQNYRSCQPILTLTNQILALAEEKYEKNLFSENKQGNSPQLLRPLSDMTQSRIVVNKIIELSQKYPLHEIAVLFRAGIQSYPVEVALNKVSIPFQKYGGIKFTEAAHIKDVLAHLRLVLNPADLPAWQRAMSLLPGVGPKTCERLYESILNGESSYIEKTCAKKKEIQEALALLDKLRNRQDTPSAVLEQVLEYYQPILEHKYPDDYPRRQTGLEELSRIAGNYEDLDTFLADMTLDNPDQLGSKGAQEDTLVLSTVHSAKGLEWSAVLVIDLVEERFPSRHALFNQDDLEEERRLLYVACTRAKEYLGLFVPDTLYNRYQDKSDPAMPSPFIREINPDHFEELRESFSGGLAKREQKPEPQKSSVGKENSKQDLGHCSHKVFGRGKIISFHPPNKYKVNFPGFGLKTVIADYLQLEDPKGQSG